MSLFKRFKNFLQNLHFFLNNPMPLHYSLNAEWINRKNSIHVMTQAQFNESLKYFAVHESNRDINSPLYPIILFIGGKEKIQKIPLRIIFIAIYLLRGTWYNKSFNIELFCVLEMRAYGWWWVKACLWFSNIFIIFYPAFAAHILINLSLRRLLWKKIFLSFSLPESRWCLFIFNGTKILHHENIIFPLFSFRSLWVEENFITLNICADKFFPLPPPTDFLKRNFSLIFLSARNFKA